MPAIHFPFSAHTCLNYNSIESGVVPDVFKISKVTPAVFKAGVVTGSGNYRPIAVLSPFAKILERFVYNQLNHLLEKESILFRHQFGFRKNYSTEQVILELTDDLKMRIDSNETTTEIIQIWMLKLKMLNQTHSLSNVLYLRVLLSVNLIFDV